MDALGLKIDVDTRRGMERGVPRLLEILESQELKATFFLSVGPDYSGRALLQILKNPLFLKKMLRTRAVGLYGWRTALYGVLLPAPMIALSFPQLVKRIIANGHEVEFHAWDHRRWQDELASKDQGWITKWFEQGISGFEKLAGNKPRAFGAPGWIIDERVLEIAGRYSFDYMSCTRAERPFVYEGSGLVDPFRLTLF